MAQSAQVRKLNPWHQRLADWLIANGGMGPGWNRRAAEEFKVTPSWISSVVHSDAFQEYYQSLSLETSKAVALSVREKMLGVADLAVETLAERVELEGKTMPVGALLEVVDVLAKRTGHGEGKVGGEAPQVQVNVVTREMLSEARVRMREVKREATPPEVISEEAPAELVPPNSLGDAS